MFHTIQAYILFFFRFGRPKRDISTIIHILNDLLCATPPQYRRGARITFEPTHNAQPITRTKQVRLDLYDSSLFNNANERYVIYL